MTHSSIQIQCKCKELCPISTSLAGGKLKVWMNRKYHATLKNKLDFKPGFHIVATITDPVCEDAPKVI